MSWRDNAACKGRTNLFFSMDPKKIATARAMCAGCTVAAECQAESGGERHGVWGGADRNVHVEFGRYKQLKLCEWCEEEFLSRDAKQRFCSRKCGGAAAFYRETDPTPVMLPSGREHGSSWAYTRGGCRCEPCRAAQAAYRRAYRKMSAS